VKVNIEDIRRQYAELSDEGLLEIERADLMEQARKCYDEELAQRGLMPAMTEAEDEASRESQELVVAANYRSLDEAELARSLIRDAGIPVRLRKEETSGDKPYSFALSLLVPAAALQAARDALTPPSDLSYIRHGIGAVRPYLYGRLDLLDFVQTVFGSVELERHEFSPTAVHAEVMIGDSVVVMEASDPPQVPATPSSIYVYVEDVDAIYQRAIEAGAVSIAEPGDRPYRERTAGVKDSSGNTWWIATYLGA
jgi:PhnB protein